jgi:hypothetical protein
MIGRLVAALVAPPLIALARSGRLTAKDHGDSAGPLFRRHVLFRGRRGALVIHQFLRSDADRCLHTHPWAFWTFILRGGYIEELPRSWICPEPVDPDAESPRVPSRVRTWRTRGPGYLGRYPADHAHRVLLGPAVGESWSLVWTGPRTDAWGFWTPRGFEPWREGYAPSCGD